MATGLVIATDPVNGTKIPKNSTVNIQVSKGAAITMPDFGYMRVSYAEARRQLQALGISVSTIEKVEDPSHTSATGDMVISQYPAAGSKIDGTVTLYVSVASSNGNQGTQTTETTVSSGN